MIGCARIVKHDRVALRVSTMKLFFDSFTFRCNRSIEIWSCLYRDSSTFGIGGSQLDVWKIIWKTFIGRRVNVSVGYGPVD